MSMPAEFPRIFVEACDACGVTYVPGQVDKSIPALAAYMYHMGHAAGLKEAGQLITLHSAGTGVISQNKH